MEIRHRYLVRSGDRHAHPSTCTRISASRCIGLYPAHPQHVPPGMEAEESLLCTRCLAFRALRHRFSMEQVRVAYRRSRLPHYDTLLPRAMDVVHFECQIYFYRQDLVPILDENRLFLADIGKK